MEYILTVIKHLLTKFFGKFYVLQISKKSFFVFYADFHPYLILIWIK